ncbi:MAG: response regulator [Candidatus Mcinerneyibacterium aminivorans]|uniref:Response regulator n=1 Tax=Candidatus Mcinerneyibacterium aminivorans TaxID=2703815 RepID=A0A5D0MCG5_9BACT|nr:MAG: response regulator [Candidatus Mcinerneyibacterium aminivorans]
MRDQFGLKVKKEKVLNLLFMFQCIKKKRIKKGKFLPKIMLADDEKNILSVLDGIRAVEQAQKEIPDLVLYEALQEKPKTSDIPVIFYLSNLKKKDVGKALEVGEKDYLTKPLTKKKLLKIIKERLERRR